MNTRQLAQLTAKIKYSELPDAVKEKAKFCFLDFLGVTMRGSCTKSAAMMREVIGKGRGSTIIGGNQSSPIEASLANGVAAHSLDLDDGHRMGHIHPGACVIPAALALSEAQEKNGVDFLEALVVGYQVAIGLGMLINPYHREKGFHTTGTCGALGAAAASAKLLNLGEGDMLNALGLAGTQAAGLLESDHSGSMGKHLHAGRAAQIGVLSALLARKGFTGAPQIIEGKEGFIRALAGCNTTEHQYGPVNNYYHILDVYFKLYPVCRHLHSSIDALFHLIGENSFKVEDVDEILVETYNVAAEHSDYRPTTTEAIRQSLPMTIAIAFCRGVMGVENPPIDTNILKTADKVVIRVKPEFEALYPKKRPSMVTIKTGDKCYHKTVNLPLGEPENPLSREDLLNKFRDLSNLDFAGLDVLDDLESYNMADLIHDLNHEFKSFGD